MKSALPRNERGDGEILVQPMIVSHSGPRSLYSNRSGNILSGGDMQTPHQTLAIQALRNTRCVEEIAHGRSSPPEISSSFHAATLAERDNDGTPSVRNRG